VGIGSIEGSPGFGLTVDLIVSLPNVTDPEQAQQILERSHKVCPYSNAIRDNVEVTLTLPRKADPRQSRAGSFLGEPARVCR